MDDTAVSNAEFLDHLIEGTASPAVFDAPGQECDVLSVRVFGTPPDGGLPRGDCGLWNVEFFRDGSHTTSPHDGRTASAEPDLDSDALVVEGIGGTVVSPEGVTTFSYLTDLPDTTLARGSARISQAVSAHRSFGPPTDAGGPEGTGVGPSLTPPDRF